MATATAIAGGVGAIGGIMKTFQGARMENEAQAKIDAFRWQELENPYETLQVSTLGSDLQTEQANLAAATATEALRTGGTRGILGGLGRVQAASNLSARQIAAGLDEQQKRIDFSKAQYDTKIQDMVESRQREELAGYGQMMNVGMGTKYQGIGNIMNAVGTVGQAGLAAQQANTNAALSSQLGAMSGAGTPAPVSQFGGTIPMGGGQATAYTGNYGVS